MSFIKSYDWIRINNLLFQIEIIVHLSLVKLVTWKHVSTTVRGGRGNHSTGATLIRLTGDTGRDAGDDEIISYHVAEVTGTSAHPSLVTRVSGRHGAAGDSAAPPVVQDPGHGGGGWRGAMGGWETAAGRQK